MLNEPCHIHYAFMMEKECPGDGAVMMVQESLLAFVDEVK
jgi:hypothetical protein